ncbi:glycosyltransferase family 2 protein [Paenibacillaceae bacterium]|nr:glycosyltransferase family 2 protein [Paenibacillaceae bacterium]
MITISLCMIVKNEENSLARCLSSVKSFADEINIVDTGSTDRTKEIARQFTKRIFDFTWVDDFAAARNFAFKQATKEFIMWLDADDVIDEKSQKIIRRLKATIPREIMRVTMPYNLGMDHDGNVTSSLRRNRLVRRSQPWEWIGRVHEYLAVGGEAHHSEAAVTHQKDKEYTDRNLKIYKAKQANNEVFSPRDLYYFANELRDHQLNEEAVEYYEKFLDTGEGWIEDNIQACMKMAECHGRLENTRQQFAAWCRSLEYDQPRAEFSCAMGAHFLTNNNYEVAIYWYTMAADYKVNQDFLSMVNRAHFTWLPHLQLCLCYDRLGQHEKAYEHNEIALQHHPSHPSMLYNKEYFSKTYGFGKTTGSLADDGGAG